MKLIGDKVIKHYGVMGMKWLHRNPDSLYQNPDSTNAPAPDPKPFIELYPNKPKNTSSGTPKLTQKQIAKAAKDAERAARKEIINAKRIKKATMEAAKLAKQVLIKSRYAKMNVAAIGAANRASTELEVEYQKRIKAGTAHVTNALGVLSNLNTKYIN